MIDFLIVISPVPPYADVGPFEATVTPHPYLYGYACGHRIYRGHATTGAPILACVPCKLVTDERRVS